MFWRLCSMWGTNRAQPYGRFHVAGGRSDVVPYPSACTGKDFWRDSKHIAV